MRYSFKSCATVYDAVTESRWDYQALLQFVLPDHRTTQQLDPANLGEDDYYSSSELWNKGPAGFEYGNLILIQLDERSSPPWVT